MTAVHGVCHALVLADLCDERHVVLPARQRLAQHHVGLVEFHKLVVKHRVGWIPVRVDLYRWEQP